VVEENPDDRIALLYVERCQARLGMISQEAGASWTVLLRAEKLAAV
jgi:hypothetical protein